MASHQGKTQFHLGKNSIHELYNLRHLVVSKVPGSLVNLKEDLNLSYFELDFHIQLVLLKCFSRLRLLEKNFSMNTKLKKLDF